uniref:Uncharacterized protein n=1 Tax=Romanomermis culicivorax TaxID=13658 RepID=A0A915K5A3_ROMCU
MCGEREDKPQNFDKSLSFLDIEAVGKILNARNLCSLIFYIILFVLFTTFMIYEIYMTINNYLTSPISTSYKIVSKDTARLPQILLCHSNVVTRSFLNTNSSDFRKAENLRNLYFGENERFSVTVDDHLTAKDMQNLYQEMALSTSVFYLVCQMRTDAFHMIPCKNITKEVFDPNYGRCHIVDVGEMEQQTPAQGLLLILNIKGSEYPNETGSAITPTYHGLNVGFGQIIDPTNMNEFVLVRPGQYVRINLYESRLNFISVDSSYFQQLCSSTDDINFDFLAANYSSKACRLECRLKTIADACNCTLPYDSVYFKDGVLDKHPFCSPKRMTECGRKSIARNKDELSRCSAKCQMACTAKRYSYSVSGMPLHAAGFPFMPDNETTLNDLIYMQIAYPQLEYTLFDQSPSMQLDDVVSNVGGQVGLWLGLSMMAIIQVPLVLCSTALWWCYSKRQGSKN